MKNIKKWTLVGVSLVLLLSLLVANLVYAAGPTYFLTGEEVFGGRTNFALYEDDADKLSSDKNIRYVMVDVWALADDDSSLIMWGNFSANATLLWGATVLLWKNTYGPWVDKAAYDSHNMSACNVSPDYFYFCWGYQGNWREGSWSNSKPYLTLSGLGGGIESDVVTSFGSTSMRGRLYSSRNGTLTKLKTDFTTQLQQVVAGAPHWNGAKNGITLNLLDDGEACLRCLSGDWMFILCDWVYEHFGINLCPMM
jgi:hypothetical protein